MSAQVSISELARRLASAHPPRLVEALSPTLFTDAHLPGAYNLPIAHREVSVGIDMTFKGFETPHQLVVGDVFVAATPPDDTDALGSQALLFDGGKGHRLTAGHPLERSDGGAL